MRKKALSAVVAGLAIATSITACSSSKKNTPSTGGATSGGSSAAAGGTIKLGVISDLTGAYSSGFLTTEKGIKAYVEGLNAEGGINGQKITYVMADTASSPPGALTAAQKLVQTDKVFAIIEVSAVYSGAEPYLLKQGIPVLGGAFDGPEWGVKSNTNLFATVGVTDYNKVNSAPGLYLKSRGVTTCGSIGYGNATSGPSATAIVKSCTAAGLKNGYLNAQVPAGSTDVGAIALAMKNAGVDGVDLPVVPNTAFALVAALKQLGVKLKSALIAVGYGGDLLKSKAAVEAAQGYEFNSTGQPVEANTPATQKMVKNLALAGVNETPTFAEQQAYIAMAAFNAGMKKAGANATRESFMTALRGISDFDADGLLSPGTVDFANLSADSQCIFAVELTGSKFVPVPGSPVCGKTVPGVTVK